METIIQLLMDNFVFIAVILVVLVLIRVFVQKTLAIIGTIFVAALVFYAFTGDASFLNKTVDTSTMAVDTVKEEVGTVDFERTSDTTFILKTKSMKVEGNEETRIATVTMGEKTFEVPLKNVYNALDKATQEKINME